MYEPIHTELVNFMRSVPEQLRVLNDATVTTCTQKVSTDINKDLKVMQTNLLKTLKENIKSEVSAKENDCLFTPSCTLNIIKLFNFSFRLKKVLSRRRLH